jgi:hypothetical protein
MPIKKFVNAALAAREPRAKNAAWLSLGGV